jgi:hypothetical protein
MFAKILDQKFIETRICFNGKSRFEREDKSKKEDRLQFKMKKHCFSNAT